MTALRWQHILLALVVVVIWGTNFVIIKASLAQFPPLLMAALRFAFAVFPAIFFFKRPNVPWSHLATYGVFVGVGQFGVLFVAMNGHISPGLASLVVQMQVLFTILLSMRFENERVELSQVFALLLAVVGIGVIAVHTDSSTSALGLLLGLFGAFNWSVGNMVTRRSAAQSGKVNMLAYVVWASLFSVPPLLALSFAFEGWPAIAAGAQHADAYAWASVLWQALGNTVFGYGVWAWLLSRYPAATITPLALLVPIVGMATATLWWGEPLPGWKIDAALLVIGGLALNMLWLRKRPAIAPVTVR